MWPPHQDDRHYLLSSIKSPLKIGVIQEKEQICNSTGDNAGCHCHTKNLKNFYKIHS